MNRIIRRSTTTLAAVALGFGALAASSGVASAHVATGAGLPDCQKVSDCSHYPSPHQMTPPKGHPNWIPGNNDPRDIPGNNDPRNHSTYIPVDVPKNRGKNEGAPIGSGYHPRGSATA